MADQHPLHKRHLFRLPVCALLGVAAGIAVALAGQPTFAVTVGWTVAAVAFALWTWLTIRGMDGTETKDHAETEDPGRGPADAIIVLAAVLSLVGVGFLLVAGSQKGASGYLEGLGGFCSVAASWFVVHMIYAVRYASLYYEDDDGGIDFPHDDQPDYQDFLYLSFCLGMTYQVSDTDITSRTIRRVVLRHTLLSYLLGAVVLASTINLVVQLASSSSGG